MYVQDKDSMKNNSDQKDLLSHETTFFAREHYAGFWRRFVAYVIDIIVANVAVLIFLLIFGINFFYESNLLQDALPGFALFSRFALLYVFILLYFTLMESSKWQATLGKRAVGIIVTDLDGRRISAGRAFGRFVAKIVSAITLYIGFFMAGFTERKQALHDIIAGTLVVKEVKSA